MPELSNSGAIFGVRLPMWLSIELDSPAAADREATLTAIAGDRSEPAHASDRADAFEAVPLAA